jgi:glycosyltransferase involved in cell wall biosynthesis
LKLSLLLPTFNSAETIERTLRAALAQRHRPLEICLYDEASQDDTREVIRRVLAEAPGDIEVDIFSKDTNSGPVFAWRVPLHRMSGDWCCFVWADDVLREDFSEKMMAGAERASAAGRKLVFSSGAVEIDGEIVPKYAEDEGVLSPVEFSLGIFLRRYSLNQINGIYEAAAAREVFDRHIQFDNPLGYDYNRYPYGNDVGFLSELGEVGGGVEILGDRLVNLVLSSQSMTRSAMRAHIWQHRWQYTYNFYRVWSWWRERGIPGAERLVPMAGRRLALCELMLSGDKRRVHPANAIRGVRAYLDYRRWDFERNRWDLPEYRRQVARLTGEIPASS